LAGRAHLRRRRPLAASVGQLPTRRMGLHPQPSASEVAPALRPPLSRSPRLVAVLLSHPSRLPRRSISARAPPPQRRPFSLARLRAHLLARRPLLSSAVHSPPEQMIAVLRTPVSSGSSSARLGAAAAPEGSEGAWTCARAVERIRTCRADRVGQGVGRGHDGHVAG